MLSVKLLRSLLLGEPIINSPSLPHHTTTTSTSTSNHNMPTHVQYDADDDHDVTTTATTHISPNPTTKIKPKKMPLLLFLPTHELISDTFRLATIARDIGMNFHPSPSLSHLLFSWPSPSSSTFSPISPLSLTASSSSSNNRPSVSSSSNTASTSNSTSALSLWGNTIPNDAVPLPFPSLSTSSSISLLRYFVSLSKNLFKLVFLEIDPNSRFNYGYSVNYNYDSSASVSLVSRVSGKQVNSMDDFSRVLAGNGWSLFRSSECKKTTPSSSSSAVYLFTKKDWNRIRAEKMINGGAGECRVRELRLPALDFKNGVPLRVLQYILLMTDDVFYLA